MSDRVKLCVVCQRSKQAHYTRVGELSSEVATRQFERIFIDHVGQFTRSTEQNNYILAVIDAFTKYVILIPVETLV